MQNTVDITYEQMINFIRHLPANQLAKVKSELENIVSSDEAETQNTDFRVFLSKGPVMSDAQYAAFKENRKSLNQWRSK
jgi:hypothetical protein